MTCESKLTIIQGKTFSRVLRWESLPYIYKPITSITKTAPAGIQATAHGLVDGWRVAVVSVQGMTEINSKYNPPKPTDFRKVTVVDANNITLNAVNAAGFSTHTPSTGYLQYYTPVDLNGYTARMSIKDRVGGTLLTTLTTENGGIAINNTTKTITLTISAVDSAALVPRLGAAYELEMVSAGGVVTMLLRGELDIVAEVTT